MRFSQRQGYTSVKDSVQRESIDGELRAGLWNVLDVRVFDRMNSSDLLQYIVGGTELASAIWALYFKTTVDTIPDRGYTVVGQIRKYFFACQWYEVYDFLEFIAPRVGIVYASSEKFQESINATLERENSAWRLVDGRIIEVTAPEEIDEIEKGLNDPSTVVRLHLRTALDMLADRKSPDYRNSIKESISAVEAVVNASSGSNGSLGATLKKLGVNAHPALEGALSKLYGYTSDADGIRHALMDEPNLDSEDARFMLVSCSAFVNYLREKARRAGVASP
jgi:hypothetical protein